MRVSRTGAILLAIALVSGEAARGQDVRMADGSSPPGVFLKGDGEWPRIVWSAVGGLAPLATPDPKSPRARDRAPLGFAEAFYVTAEHDGYILLARPAADGESVSQQVGWAERGTLVLRREAEIDRESRVPRKVLIVNTVVSLQDRRRGPLVEFPTRLGPSAEAPPGPKVGLLDLTFRYLGRDGWVLIGPDPDLFADPNRRSPGLIGWVPEELTVPFDGRLGAAWDRREDRPDPGRIYRNPADAYRATKAGQSVPALFVEQPPGPARPGSRPTPRFPILPYEGDPDYPRFDPASNVELLKVVGLGAFLDAEEARRDAAKVSEEIAGLRARLAAPTQILFVIDDTGSMGQHFGTVASTVGRILVEAHADGRPVEVAVSYYNDVDRGTKDGYQTMSLRSLKVGEVAGFVAQVRTHPTVQGGDFPEMLFEGLAHAIEASGWDAASEAPKVVILIGDHGDLPVRADPKRIVRALKGHGHPIAFHAVQVVDPAVLPAGAYGKEQQEAAEAFRSQMNAIKDGMGGPPAASTTIVRDADKVAGLGLILDAKFAEMKAGEAKLQETLVRLEAREFPAKVSDELEVILKERPAIDLTVLRSFDGLRVGHVPGYLWSRGRVPGPGRARKEVLLSRPELQRLVAELGKIPDPGTDVLGSLKDRLSGQAGLSFEDAFLRPLGLTASSRLLTLTTDRLTPERATRLAAEVHVRRGRLMAILNDRPAAPSGRFFRTRGGMVDWTWVDFEEELP